jgi:hypothetical protein
MPPRLRDSPASQDRRLHELRTIANHRWYAAEALAIADACRRISAPPGALASTQKTGAGRKQVESQWLRPKARAAHSCVGGPTHCISTLSRVIGWSAPTRRRTHLHHSPRLHPEPHPQAGYIRADGEWPANLILADRGRTMLGLGFAGQRNVNHGVLTLCSAGPWDRGNLCPRRPKRAGAGGQGAWRSGPGRVSAGRGSRVSCPGLGQQRCHAR